jgi:acyl carrier protein
MLAVTFSGEVEFVFMVNPVEDQIIEIVSAITKAPAAVIGLDTDLRLDFNVDSLQGLQIMAAIEKRFGIQIPDDDLGLHTSVRVISQTVVRLRDQPAGSSTSRAM